MVQARMRDLHACPQAAWHMFADFILRHVGAGTGEGLVCRMSLGYAGPDTVVQPVPCPALAVSRVQSHDGVNGA